MGDYEIVLTCRAGHVQRITLHDVSEQHAKTFAAIMDGTDPMYLFDPRRGENQSGWIGHCQHGAKWSGFPPITMEEAKELGACGELFDAVARPI